MKCPKCQTELEISAESAAHNEEYIDILVRCPKGDYLGNEFIHITQLTEIQE